MNTQTILNVVGGVLIAVGIIKVSIIGFYPNEAPLFIGLLVAGLVCLSLARNKKMADEIDRDEDVVKRAD